MVGPISGDDRESAALRIKVAFSVLVGASAGLITLQGHPSLAVVAGAVLGGLAVGALLVRYVFPGTGEVVSERRRFD